MKVWLFPLKCVDGETLVWRVERTLGKGCSGKVLLVSNINKLNKRAAKCIDKDWVQEKCEREQRLKEEIKILRQVNHENIVSFVDVFTTPNCHVILMEWCPNGCLRDHVKRNGSLSDVVSMSFVSDVASALDYLHSKNIIHRDVKLHNMLLYYGDTSKRTTIKMCDFGLSCRLRNKHERRKSFVGTPNFVAPDIIES